MRPSGTPNDYYRQKKTIEQEEEPSISPMTHTKKPVEQTTKVRRRSPPKKIDED